MGHGHNGDWGYSYRFQGSGRGHNSRDGSSLNYRISSSRSRDPVSPVQRRVLTSGVIGRWLHRSSHEPAF